MRRRALAASYLRLDRSASAAALRLSPRSVSRDSQLYTARATPRGKKSGYRVPSPVTRGGVSPVLVPSRDEDCDDDPDEDNDDPAVRVGRLLHASTVGLAQPGIDRVTPCRPALILGSVRVEEDQQPAVAIIAWPACEAPTLATGSGGGPTRKRSSGGRRRGPRPQLAADRPGGPRPVRLRPRRGDRPGAPGHERTRTSSLPGS